MAVRIRFNLDTIKFISFFENLTRVKVKDCFDNDGKLTFVVSEESIGKAIGKNSCNIRKIESLTKKRIKVVGYNEILEKFVKNAIFPLKIVNYEFDEETKIVTLTAIDSKTRGYLIGRSASNLRNYETIVKRYFDITEIKVNWFLGHNKNRMAVFVWRIKYTLYTTKNVKHFFVLMRLELINDKIVTDKGLTHREMFINEPHFQ